MALKTSTLDWCLRVQTRSKVMWLFDGAPTFSVVSKSSQGNRLLEFAPERVRFLHCIGFGFIQCGLCRECRGIKNEMKFQARSYIYEIILFSEHVVSMLLASLQGSNPRDAHESKHIARVGRNSALACFIEVNSTNCNGRFVNPDRSFCQSKELLSREVNFNTDKSTKSRVSLISPQFQDYNAGFIYNYIVFGLVH